ncbi:RDD family protein, partial [Streptomyces sp. NPDC049577]|uniref:RDD family protein n=1 Tax=Streptomyces sp. NPDC049577 TaxID=3155153 RepID=UPI00344482B0
MDNRQAIGSWLSGPRAAAEEMGIEFGHRGERLGLPEQGPGSIAPLGRRFGAVFVDWALCMLVAYGFFSHGDPQRTGNWALLIFFLLALLTVGTVGCTPGKRLLGLRVVAEGGGRLWTRHGPGGWPGCGRSRRARATCGWSSSTART